MTEIEKKEIEVMEKVLYGQIKREDFEAQQQLYDEEVGNGTD